MKIDIDALHDFHDRGALIADEWGDARETACLMSALTGATDFDGCVAAGWPLWLAEMGAYIFDDALNCQRWTRAVAFAEAVKAAETREADFHQMFRNIRLRAVLPIALEAVGQSDEPWRVKCQQVVQWSIDHDGDAAKAAWVAEAACVARASFCVRAIAPVRAAEAAGAVCKRGAAGASSASWAARAATGSWAAWAAANTRIFDATIAALRGDQ